MLLAALIPVAVAALILEPGGEITWGLPTVLILLYSGPLATAFANWASQSITRSLAPLTSAMGFLLTPVVGLIAGPAVPGQHSGPHRHRGLRARARRDRGGLARPAKDASEPLAAADVTSPSRRLPGFQRGRVHRGAGRQLQRLGLLQPLMRGAP